MGLSNTPAGYLLVLITAGLPISILIMRSFFTRQPQELEEAAALDGCTAFGTFWRIMLPWARPALAALAVIQALSVWNEYLMALVLFNSEDLMPVQGGLTKFLSAETPEQQILHAADHRSLRLRPTPPDQRDLAGRDQVVRRTHTDGAQQRWAPSSFQLIERSSRSCRKNEPSASADHDGWSGRRSSNAVRQSSLMVWNYQHVKNMSFRTTIDMAKLPVNLRRGPVGPGSGIGRPDPGVTYLMVRSRMFVPAPVNTR
ncbi:carbohydrate ABC transporter permease [Kribbella soli]|uniref:Carbohydrate ABC transporter permease n=1 Tax=Kribbella soli TaxID=1124743 RepID=A0A4R0H9R8_9ACTN|nr:carbohydrate ABC transporter permease [Kribbella soli]TCC07171.1 carbohydrate ABC transporter permease [Kribbella soli]